MTNIENLSRKIISRTGIKKQILLSSNPEDSCDTVIKLKLPEKVRYGSKDYESIRRNIIQYGEPVVLLADRNNRIFINRLLWECPNVYGIVYLNSRDAYEIEEPVTKKDILLWDLQVYKAKDNDRAFMSGWKNSYDNKEFSREELEEYIENSRFKLTPYIGKETDVLEAGIGSGMIAVRLSQLCRSYDGCDISSLVLDKLKSVVKEKNLNNVNLYHCSADQVDQIGKNYDVILMSSVTEYFSGYNYFRLVIRKCIDTLKEKGILFFADVFDLNMKEAYQESVQEYERIHPGCHCKHDFSHELYIPRVLWMQLKNEFPEIIEVIITDKIGIIRNEINKFRYDVLLTVNKGHAAKIEYKFQLAAMEDELFDGKVL
jgi:ubiquinone/menaquinone biosynthesis C-methylase UbiE